MSKERRDLDYLVDIQDAIVHILEFTRGMTWESYLNNRLVQDAVVRNLEVLGEASKKVSPSYRFHTPSIPWADMSGTRDRLIHHYFGINQEIVWQIIQYDLPGLQKKIDTLIQNFPAGDA